MNITYVLIALIISVTIIWSVYLIKSCLEAKYVLQSTDIDNERYRLYNDIDPGVVLANIQAWADNAIAEYIFKNISTRSNTYMSSTDIETMVKTVSAILYKDISPLYLYYIKLLVDLEDDDALIVYINELVKMRSIDFIKANNKLN